MADKVKLTPPMTDSKTPDWVKEEARKLAYNLSNMISANYVDYTTISPDDSEVDAASQALLSAYARGRKEGIEEAAKVGFQVSQHVHAKAEDVSKSIRQLLEVK